MRIPLLIAATGLALSAQAGVTVNFVNPEKYADIGRYRDDRVQAQKDLGGYLQRLGESLPRGVELTIDVLDVDLAGEEHFAAGGAKSLRVLRGGADWPSIRLRYTVERDGRKEEPREAQLSDMGYQQHARRAEPSEAFPYEKRLLADWFNSLGLAPEQK